MEFNYFTRNREIVNMSANITDRTSFLELAHQFMNQNKVLKVADPSHIMAFGNRQWENNENIRDWKYDIWVKAVAAKVRFILLRCWYAICITYPRERILSS